MSECYFGISPDHIHMVVLVWILTSLCNDCLEWSRADCVDLRR